jgi:hypothetical protein
MKTTAVRQRKTQVGEHPDKTAARRDLHRVVLEQVISLIVASGSSREVVAEIISEIMDQVERDEAPRMLTRMPSVLSTPTQVLSLWKDSPRYADSSGRPAAIPVSGKAPSFAALCETIDAEADPSKVLATLQRYGSVQAIDGDLLTITRGFAVMNKKDEDSASYMVISLAELLHTMTANRHLNKEMLQRGCFSDTFDIRAIGQLTHVVEVQTESFIDVIDKAMARHDIRSTPDDARLMPVGDEGAKPVRVSVGVCLTILGDQ